jgi:3-oxoacyl-[acyl-carrier protein] reductase
MNVAIVTGAAGAIGRAIAGSLARDGHAILAVDQNPDVSSLCSELQDSGASAAACVLDLGASDSPAAILDAATTLGDPHVLVNNAGITRDQRALKMELEDFRHVIRINLIAPLRLASAIAPELADGGSLINVASRAALGNFGQANYVTAKAALAGATRALALQSAPRIRVNAIAPGLVDTPMTAAMPSEVLRKLIARVPARRAADPSEVADLASYLASDRASYITGQLVLACGGRSIAP